MRVLLEFLELLLARTAGRHVPVKFIMFSLVGGLGVLVHMLTLGLLHRGFSVDFSTAHIAATAVAMTTNFFVNNLFTYFDRRLRGWRLLPGWSSFYAASSVGAWRMSGSRFCFWNASERPGTSRLWPG